VSRLALELDAGHVVAEAVLELALGRDAAVRGLVTVHERLDDEAALVMLFSRKQRLGERLDAF